MEPVIEARGLVKRYGELEAVAGVDLEVRPGEFFGMLGPNGAGKTTTMRMIYRVTPITAGSLKVLGYQAGVQDREIKARLGVVPQVDNLDEELDPLENLLLYARYNDIEPGLARRRAGELLDFMELGGKARAPLRTLSGGMLRRLTLVTRALLYGGVFLLVTLPFGVPTPPSLLLAPLAILLVGLCFAALGMAFTAVIESIDLYTYFPIQERFPEALVRVAQATPLYHSVQLMRAVMVPGTEDVPAAFSVLYLLGLGTALGAFSVTRLSRRVIR